MSKAKHNYNGKFIKQFKDREQEIIKVISNLDKFKNFCHPRKFDGLSTEAERIKEEYVKYLRTANESLQGARPSTDDIEKSLIHDIEKHFKERFEELEKQIAALINYLEHIETSGFENILNVLNALYNNLDNISDDLYHIYMNRVEIMKQNKIDEGSIDFDKIILIVVSKVIENYVKLERALTLGDKKIISHIVSKKDVEDMKSTVEEIGSLLHGLGDVLEGKLYEESFVKRKHGEDIIKIRTVLKRIGREILNGLEQEDKKDPKTNEKKIEELINKISDLQKNSKSTMPKINRIYSIINSSLKILKNYREIDPRILIEFINKLEEMKLFIIRKAEDHNDEFCDHYILIMKNNSNFERLLSLIQEIKGKMTVRASGGGAPPS